MQMYHNYTYLHKRLSHARYLATKFRVRLWAKMLGKSNWKCIRQQSTVSLLFVLNSFINKRFTTMNSCQIPAIIFTLARQHVSSLSLFYCRHKKHFALYSYKQHWQLQSLYNMVKKMITSFFTISSYHRSWPYSLTFNAIL